MQFSEEYVTRGVSMNQLETELGRLRAELPNNTELQADLQAAGVDLQSALSLPANSIIMQQAAGFDTVVTPILVTLGSKVAYDLWKVLLGRMQQKWGANAVSRKPDGRQSKSHSAG